MSANIDQLTPTESLIDLSKYTGAEFTLPDFQITKLFDDLILAEFVDVSPDGDAIKRGGIFVPLNATPKAWRVGKVHLLGEKCDNVSVDDVIVFPSDKGIPVTNLQYTTSTGDSKTVKHGIFLNQERLFGVCKPTHA